MLRIQVVIALFIPPEIFVVKLESHEEDFRMGVEHFITNLMVLALAGVRYRLGLNFFKHLGFRLGSHIVFGNCNRWNLFQLSIASILNVVKWLISALVNVSVSED